MQASGVMKLSTPVSTIMPTAISCMHALALTCMLHAYFLSEIQEEV